MCSSLAAGGRGPGGGALLLGPREPWRSRETFLVWLRAVEGSVLLELREQL
jgi:hypothetical protein